MRIKEFSDAFIKTKEANKSKLIRQIFSFFYIAIIVTTIVGGVFMYYFAMDIMLDSEMRENIQMMENLAYDFEYYGYTEWYLDYWKSNCEKMDISWDESRKLSNEITERGEELDAAYLKEYGMLFSDVITRDVGGDGMDHAMVYLDFERINPEELRPDIQKLLAEYVYLSILYSFDNYKNRSFLKHLYCFTQIDGEEMMVLFSGRRDTEIYGTEASDIYKLGKIINVPRDKYPSYYKTYDRGQVLEGEALFLNDKNGDSLFRFYYPICDENGKTLCVIGVSGGLSNVFDMIQKPFWFIIASYVVAMLVMAAIVAVMLLKRAIIPIDIIQEGVKNYSLSKNSDELSKEMSKIKMSNEIGLLSTELSGMGNELSRYITEVTEMTREKQRLNTELDLATRIQKSSLVNEFDTLPKKWNVNLYGCMTPAKEVGGDFYDFIPLDDDHIALIIGDVSGKGVPAALLMMISLVIFRNECRYSMEPTEIMKAVNNALCDRDFQEMFVTAWIGILELSTGLLKEVNAGHENPIIKRKDGSVEVIKNKHGVALAAMENMSYRSTEYSLGEGDTIIVYTDGVAEAINSDNVQYGVDRLVECLRSHDLKRSDEYTEAVMTDIKNFVGEAEQFDDITMLILKYK